MTARPGTFTLADDLDDPDLGDQPDDDYQADQCPCPNDAGGNEPDHNGVTRWFCYQCLEFGAPRTPHSRRNRTEDD